MTNFNDTFAKLSLKAGIIVALTTLEDSLPDNFWQTLSLEQLVHIYTSAYDYPHFRQAALDQIKNTTATFRQWFDVAPTTGIYKELDILIFKNLINVAQNFDDTYRSVFKYMFIKIDFMVTQSYEKKLFDFAQTFRNWQTVYINSSTYPKNKIIALEKMVQLQKSSHDLIDINHFNPTPETLSAAVSAIDSDPGDALGNWGSVYQKICLSPELKDYALIKIRELSDN